MVAMSTSSFCMLNPDATNDARKSIPTIVICTAYTADEYRDAVANAS